jgi:hypothetical protein
MSGAYLDKLYELYLEIRRLDGGSTAVVQFAEMPKDHFCLQLAANCTRTCALAEPFHHYGRGSRNLAGL